MKGCHFSRSKGLSREVAMKAGGCPRTIHRSEGFGENLHIKTENQFIQSQFQLRPGGKLLFRLVFPLPGLLTK